MSAPLFLLQAAAGPNSIFVTIAMYVVIAAIFYFVLLRPQQRQRREHEQTIRTLKRGDEIVTAGGIVGEVVHIKEQSAGAVSGEDQITIRSGESRLIVERGRIARVRTARPAATGA